MSISSIGNNWSIFSNYFQTQSTAVSQVSQNTAANDANLQNIIYSNDGDRLELSGDAQTAISGFMMYGPPQGPPPEGMGPGSEMKDFLDKVANGTATNDDLKNMQSVLQNMQSQRTAGQNESNNFQTDLQSFLDKVANGTTTDDDLKSMQSELQKAQQQSGGNKVHRHHHHHHSSESEGTNPNGTSLDTTNSTNADSSLKNFLDKVANGTATSEDLQNMQSVLQQIQQQFYSNNTSQDGSSTKNSSLEA